MNFLWGILCVLIGLFLMISAFKKSEFIIYRILIARSRLLWKDNVHELYKFVGGIIIVLGILFFFNVFN